MVLLAGFSYIDSIRLGLLLNWLYNLGFAYPFLLSKAHKTGCLGIINHIGN